jgi:hypothetical protein
MIYLHVNLTAFKMNIAEEDVRLFYQTHTITELAEEILKAEGALKSRFRNHREKLDQLHFENRINILKQLKVQVEILPQWYTTISEIPVDLNSDYADDTHFDVLENVEVSLLISLLSCGNSDAFLKKELYHLFSQKKTDAIALLITSGKKLVPPLISYHAASNNLRLDDGRHRFRSALVAEQSHVPILITKTDYASIFKLLIF